MANKWWQETVVYQIYPRSFMDSGGDGIGDLKGVTQRLEYLHELGVGAIWMNPICDSPNDDNGYDIRDYTRIMREYGSMDDFDALVEKAHALGIRVVMDMVINHTSDEHAWFVESRGGKDSPKHDFYIWRDGTGSGPPNNWGSFFSPSAWKYDEQRGQYYLHLFSEKQPDLNWESPALRGEIYDMMNWWRQKGVDGFRLDAINAIKKPKGLPDSKEKPTYALGTTLDPALYMNNPGLEGFFREMNRRVFSKGDMLTVGECSQTTPAHAAKYASLKGDMLSMLIHFDAVSLRDKWSVKAMRKVQQRWYDDTWGIAWAAQYLSNHDQPRQVSIYGDDGKYHQASAKLLATMLHTLPGTPFVYQGEELGMTNIRMRRVNDYQDISAHNDYHRMRGTGHSRRKAMAWLNRYGRDNARTPMQWDNTANAGFTTGAPWLKVNPNYQRINAAQQIGDPDSVFNYYRKLIALRKQHSVMIYGDYADISPGQKNVYMYTRSDDTQTWMVVLNFSGKRTVVRVASDIDLSRVVLTNDAKAAHTAGRIVCPPWYAAIFKVR